MPRPGMTELGSLSSTENWRSHVPFAASVKFVMTVSPGKTEIVSPVTACPVHDTPDGSGTPEWFSTPKKYCDWITHSAGGGGRM